MEPLGRRGQWAPGRWGTWPWLAVAVGLLAGVVPAQAQFLYRRVNLANLVQGADIIVQGRVTEVRYEGLPGYPHISTARVTLEVERMLRGPAGKQYTFREFLLPANRARGKRGYAVGQRLLLFLPEPSQYGLSSPLGGEQGRFRIQPDQRGNVVVANEFGNLGLFHNVAESAAQSSLSLSSEELRVAGTARGPVRLDDFVSLVEQLASVPKFE